MADQVESNKKKSYSGEDRSGAIRALTVLWWQSPTSSSLCAGLCFPPVHDANASDPPPRGDWSMLQCASLSPGMPRAASHGGTDSPKSPGVRGAGASNPFLTPPGRGGTPGGWWGPPDGSFIPRSSSRGERGDTGRLLRGGTRGCARWRVPSAWSTTTCTHLHFIEQAGPPSWRMLVGGKASASSFGLFPLTLGGLLASLWPGVGLAGLLKWALGMAGELHHELLGGFHPSGPRPSLGSLVQAQRSNWWASRVGLHQLPPGTKEVASYRCLFNVAPDTSVKYQATASVNFILKPFSVLFPICPKGWYPCPADSSRQGEQS